MECLHQEPPLQLVAQLLVKGNLIDKEQALQLQMLATSNKQGFIQFIVANQILSEQCIATFLGERFQIPSFDLDAIEISSQTTQLLNLNLIKKHGVLPLFKRENQLFLGTEDPSQESALKDIQFCTGLQIKLCVVESNKLRQRINKIIHQTEAKVTSVNKESELAKLDFGFTDLEEPAGILGETQDAPIIRFVNNILMAAMKRRASDIHFEPYETTYRIRYRIDGVLVEVSNLPVSLISKITARVKILSNLDISERRIPQDGRFHITHPQHHEVECRVSTCPTSHGEKVVIRLLDSTATHFNIDELGLNDEQKKTF